MRKPLLRSTLLAAVLASSPLALAAVPPAPGTSGKAAASQHAGHRGGHAMGILDQLGLTDSQRTQVRQLLEQAFAQARPEMQALRQKRMAFDNATPGSQAYQTAAADLAQAESNAARAQVMRQADLRTKIYNLLTPEQRSRYASLRTQREARMKQWREAHRQQPRDHAPASSSTVQ